MSTPARSLRGSASASKPKFLSDGEKPSFIEEFYDLVSNRAYALFERFGRVHGEDVSHWLQAERELASFPAVQESKDTFTVTIPVGEIPEDRIKVCATDERVIISATSETAGSDSPDAKGPLHEAQSLYYMAVWPEPVSAGSYNAEVRDGLLTLTVRKASPHETEEGPGASPETGNAVNTSKDKVK